MIPQCLHHISANLLRKIYHQNERKEAMMEAQSFRTQMEGVANTVEQKLSELEKTISIEEDEKRTEENNAKVNT